MFVQKSIKVFIKPNLQFLARPTTYRITTVASYRTFVSFKQEKKQILETQEKVDAKAEELKKPAEPNKPEVGLIQAVGRATVHFIAWASSLATTVVLTSFSVSSKLLAPALHKLKLPTWLSRTVKVLKYALKAIEIPIKFVLPRLVKLAGFVVGKMLAKPYSKLTSGELGESVSSVTKTTAAQTVSQAIGEAKESAEKTTAEAASRILDQDTDRNTASIIKDLTELGKDLKETVDSVSSDVIQDLVSEAGKTATSSEENEKKENKQK